VKALGSGKGHLDAMVRIGLTVDIVLQLRCSSAAAPSLSSQRSRTSVGASISAFRRAYFQTHLFVLALFHSSSYSSELSSSSVSMVGSIAGITKFSSSLLSISPLSCMMVWGGGDAGVSLATRTACGV